MTLGQVLQPQLGGKLLQQGWSPRCHPYPAEASGDWGVLKTTAIQPGSFVPIHNKALPDSLEPRPNIVVKAGDILMTCAGPRSRCGIPTLVRSTPANLMMSGKMYRFRAQPELLTADFLEYWLLSPTAQKMIDVMKTGISDSGLNLTQQRFLKLPVPLPSLTEQHRIVEILEGHLSRLDAADASLLTVQGRADVWMEATSSLSLWRSEFDAREVKELLREPMRNGRSDRVAQSGEESTRTLTLTAVTKNEFLDTNTKLTTTSRSAAAGLWLEPGDIFVQRANTPELVGTTARFDGPRDWAIFPDLLVRLRADEAVIDSRFLCAALRTKRGHDQMRRRAKGLASSMPKIDQATIGSTMVPVPTLDEQSRILEQLTEAASSHRRVTASIEFSLERSKALRRAVLAAAFDGRLTGHRIDDEIIEEEAARVEWADGVASD